MKKIDYDLWQDNDYVDISVFCMVGGREWKMSMYRCKETLAITNPLYEYASTKYDSFEEVPRIPKRVQAYFDAAMPQAKTLLILGSN